MWHKYLLSDFLLRLGYCSNRIFCAFGYDILARRFSYISVKHASQVFLWLFCDKSAPSRSSCTEFCTELQGSHGEILIEVLCQSHILMWKYAMLSVFKIIVKYLLCHNFDIFLKPDFLLITFCLEGQQMLCANVCAHWSNCLRGVRKSWFSTFRKKKNIGENGRISWLSSIQGTRGYKVF